MASRIKWKWNPIERGSPAWQLLVGIGIGFGVGVTIGTWAAPRTVKADPPSFGNQFMAEQTKRMNELKTSIAILRNRRNEATN